MTKCSYANDGHAQGHVRDMFHVVIEKFFDWEPPDREPTVEFEGREIPISAACSLLWNCSDILPSNWRATFTDYDYGELNTYASAARCIKKLITRQNDKMDAFINATIRLG